jgi:hypothetical protein
MVLGGKNGRRGTFRHVWPTGRAAEAARSQRNVQSTILSGLVMVLTSINRRLHVIRRKTDFLAQIPKLFFAPAMGIKEAHSVE